MSEGQRQDLHPPDETDIRFVETALNRGVMNRDQLAECERSCQRLREQGEGCTLAQVAVRKNFLSESQADAITSDLLPSAVPAMVGNYRIVAKIGEGGMGAVYKARHVKLGNYAAVKFLPAELAKNPSFVMRFEREAELAAQLTSAYSVRVFDVGEVTGTRFILMEFVEGESLDALLKREGRLPDRRALSIVRDIALAVEQAHEMGIVHRDIKPGNILLTHRGTPKLTDLGIAKQVENDNLNITATGSVVGTPSYMSPEQAQGMPDIDIRSDIYSLGATLYRMAVGDLPFKGNTPQNVMYRIASEPVGDPMARNPALGRETAAIICKMMAKEREQRYQSMRAVIDDIEAFLTGGATSVNYEETINLLEPTRRGTPTTEVASPRRRKGVMVAVIMVLALLALGGGAVYVAVRGLPWSTGGKAGESGAQAKRDEGAQQAPDPTPPASAVNAAALLSQARSAMAAAKADEARALAERVIKEFAGEPEGAQAKDLIAELDRAARADAAAAKLVALNDALAAKDEARARALAAAIEKDYAGTAEATAAAKAVRTLDEGIARKGFESVQAAVRELLAKPDAAAADFTRALAMIDDAAKQHAGNDQRAAAERKVVEERWATAYAAAFTAGKAAMDKSDWTVARAQFERARSLKPGAEVDQYLAGVERAMLAQAFAQATEPRQKLDILVKSLSPPTTIQEQALIAAARELQSRFQETEAAAQESEALSKRFKDKVDAGVQATATTAGNKLQDARTRLAKVSPRKVSEVDLKAVSEDLALARADYAKAVRAMLTAAYPGLGSARRAERMLAAHRARQEAGASATVDAVYAEMVPDEACTAIVSQLAVSKARAAEYDSAAEAAAVRAGISDAIARCDALAKTPEGKDRAVELRTFALERRAVALLAEKKPLDAMADLCAAGSAADGEAMREAVVAFMDQLGGEVDKAPEQAVTLVKGVGEKLAGDLYAPARAALGKEAARGAMRGLMANLPMARAWIAAVGPLQPAGMVSLPAGKIIIGFDYRGPSVLTPASSPPHEATVQEFYIDTCEVTNAEFKAFIADGGYAKDLCWTEAVAVGVDRTKFVDTTGKPGPKYWANGSFAAGEDNLPVVGVCWYEAAAYARWAGKRLPTENEWECAARGVRGKDGGGYAVQALPWGDEYAKGKANLRDSDAGKPTAVRSWANDKTPSGCYDMLGNVVEWTADPFLPYPNSPSEDRHFGKANAAARGLGYADSPIGRDLLTFRRGKERVERDAETGFRCAWSAAEE